MRERRGLRSRAAGRLLLVPSERPTLGDRDARKYAEAKAPPESAGASTWPCEFIADVNTIIATRGNGPR
jgi:hypothetical protein